MYNTSEKILQCDQCVMFLPTNSNFAMYKTRNSVRHGKSAESINNETKKRRTTSGVSKLERARVEPTEKAPDRLAETVAELI